MSARSFKRLTKPRKTRLTMMYMLSEFQAKPLGTRLLLPKLIKALEEKDAGDIIVICGGVIPQQDYEFLKKAGVKAIFGPGTNIPEAASDILRLIRERRA